MSTITTHTPVRDDVEPASDRPQDRDRSSRLWALSGVAAAHKAGIQYIGRPTTIWGESPGMETSKSLT